MIVTQLLNNVYHQINIISTTLLNTSILKFSKNSLNNAQIVKQQLSSTNYSIICADRIRYNKLQQPLLYNKTIPTQYQHNTQHIFSDLSTTSLIYTHIRPYPTQSPPQTFIQNYYITENKVELQYLQPQIMNSQLQLESQESILSKHNHNQQYIEVPPHQLSGDENAEKSFLLSETEGKKANFFLSTMTIMKTVIGVGVLGLPYVMKNLGWVLGLLIFLSTTFLNQYSCIILLKVKNLSHHSNYSTIGYYIFKSKWFQAYTYFLILFNNFGVCLAELTIFKQTFQMIIMEFWKDLQPNWYFQPWFITGICLSVVLLPFTFVSKIQKLKYLALLGITAISCFIISMIINFIKRYSEFGQLPGVDIKAFPTNAFDAISSVPNILLAFLYQINLFPIYKGLKQANDKKMLNASMIGTFSCFLIYSSAGLMGYFSYGSKIMSSNFLISLKREEIGTPLYIIMNSIFIISVLCSFPLIFYGARNNFIALFKIIRSSKNRGDEGQLRHADSIVQISEYIVSNNKEKKKLIAQILFYGMTLVLYAIIMVVAITVGELGKTFNIVGAIASNSIGFILPTLFYFMLIYKKKKPRNSNFYASIAMFSLAIPFGVLAVVCQFI